MKLEDYIAVLQRKLEEVGNVDVAMTQGGYYADGRFADLYDEPQIEVIDLGSRYIWVDGVSHIAPKNEKTFLVLGHSYQSY